MSLRAAVPAKGMLALLEVRKEGLQAMIRERFCAARLAGTVADVSALTATLRAVKASLKAAMGKR